MVYRGWTNVLSSPAKWLCLLWNASMFWLISLILISLISLILITFFWKLACFKSQLKSHLFLKASQSLSWNKKILDHIWLVSITCDINLPWLLIAIIHVNIVSTLIGYELFGKQRLCLHYVYILSQHPKITLSQKVIN